MTSDEKVESLCGNCLVELRDCQWLLHMRPWPGAEWETIRENGYNCYRMVKCPKFEDYRNA